MGLFSNKASHAKSVEAAYTVFGNLYEVTAEGGGGAPAVLEFSLPDSRYRYLLFCLSTVMTATASRMKNADAVLNELLHRIVSGALLADPNGILGGPTEPQDAANRGAKYVQEYLHRWSCYLEVRDGGNRAAAISLIVGMLQTVESEGLPNAAQVERLFPLGEWIERNLESMRDGFSALAR